MFNLSSNTDLDGKVQRYRTNDHRLFSMNAAPSDYFLANDSQANFPHTWLVAIDHSAGAEK